MMLDDTSIKAILCGRGGYGLSRIIDSIKLSKFKKILNGLLDIVM